MADRIEFRSGVERDALTILWNGLEHLDARMIELEDAESSRMKGWIGGGSSAWNHSDQLLANYFMWYATSAYCFLTLFAKTHVLKGSDDEKLIKKQVTANFPRLVTWRHKVGAHMAFVVDWNDTPTTRKNSVLLMVDFEIETPGRGRFWIGNTVVKDALPDQGDCADWRWSLTREHERISDYVRKHV